MIKITGELPNFNHLSLHQSSFQYFGTMKSKLKLDDIKKVNRQSYLYYRCDLVILVIQLIIGDQFQIFTTQVWQIDRAFGGLWQASWDPWNHPQVSMCLRRPSSSLRKPFPVCSSNWNWPWIHGMGGSWNRFPADWKRGLCTQFLEFLIVLISFVKVFCFVFHK